MFVKLFVLLFVSHTFLGRAQDTCQEWKTHKNFHLIHTKDDCGKVKFMGDELGSRVMNGRDTLRGEHPWMAWVTSVYKNGGIHSICGGTIINEKYILTAAHCITKYTIEVLVGTHTIRELNRCKQSNGSVCQVIEAETVTTYSTFDINVPENDIALIRLKRSVSLKSLYINYVCLPASCDFVGSNPKENFEGEDLIITGWGDTMKNDSHGYLQEGIVKVKKCVGSRFNGKFYDPVPSKICTKGERGGEVVSHCSGDSGGPLLFKTSERAIQVGIISIGNECGSEANKYVTNKFTRVVSFMKWILDNMKP